MRFLPVFLDLTAGTVMLVGSGEAALNKLRLLASAGARVRWFVASADIAQATAIAADLPDVDIVTSDPLAADLSDTVALVTAAGRPLDDAIAARAKAARVPVNVVDRADLSTLHRSGDRRSRRRGGGDRHRRRMRRCWRAACANASRRCCRRGSAISPP